MPRTNAHVGVVWTSRDSRLLASQKRIRNQQRQINRSVDAFTSRIAALGAGFIGFNVLIGQLNQLRSTFDDLNKRSRELGLSARSTLILRSAFEQAGVAGDRVTRTLGRILDFQRQLRTGRLTESITRGVNEDLLNLVRRGGDLNSILAELSESTAEELTAFARAAGIRDTTQFVRVVEELGAPLQRTRRLFDDLNIALSDSALTLNEEFNDALSRLSATLTATFADFVLGNVVVQGLSQEEIANRLDDIIREITRTFRGVLFAGREIVNEIRRLSSFGLDALGVGILARLAGLFTIVGAAFRFGRGALGLGARGATRAGTSLRERALYNDGGRGIVRPAAGRRIRYNAQGAPEFTRVGGRLNFLVRWWDELINISNSFLNSVVGKVASVIFALTVGRRIRLFFSLSSRLISIIFSGVSRLWNFLRGTALFNIALYGVVGDYISRYWDDILGFLSSVGNSLGGVFGLVDYIRNLNNRIRNAYNRGFNPDPNDTRSFIDRVVGGDANPRQTFLESYNSQFKRAERTANDYAMVVRQSATTIARTLNDTLNEMVRGIADGTANMRTIWRNFLNTFIKTLQDALVLRPLEEGITQIAGAVGRGILGFTGSIPSQTRPLDYIDRITPGLNEFGVGGVIPTTAQAQSPVVVNQEFTFNRGVDAVDVADMSLQAAQAVQSDFLIKVGRAGTPESRAIKGY